MRAALLALVALTAAAPAWSEPPPPLRLSQLSSLSDAALVRRMFGDLAAFPIVSWRPERRVYRSPQQRAEIWFWTRPRASDRAGLCETDRMIVGFVAAELTIGPDPVMEPRRFDLQTYYIIRDRSRARALSGSDRPEAEQACAALDPRRDGIPADYPWQLMKALELVADLGAGARAARAPAPLDCAGMDPNGFGPPIDAAACLPELRGLYENSVVWVSQCHGGPPGGDCIRVQVSSRFIEFELSPGQSPVRIVVRGIQDTSAVE